MTAFQAFGRPTGLGGRVRQVGGEAWAEQVFVTDPFMQYAIDEIYSTYGDRVEVKNKSLRKFGRTLNAGVGVKTTVAEFQDAVVNETFAVGNTIDKFVSTSASDTGQMVVEGHTVDTETGKLTFRVQTVTLTGQTAGDLNPPLNRVTRSYVKAGTYASPAANLVGDVTFYASSENSGLTSGKPDTDSAVKLMVKGTAGRNQSEKCATSISDADYWALTVFQAGVANGGPQDATVAVDIEYRTIGGVWLPLGVEPYIYGGQAMPPIDFKPYAIIPSNSDVRCVVVSDKASTQITARIVGQLLTVSG